MSPNCIMLIQYIIRVQTFLVHIKTEQFIMFLIVPASLSDLTQ